MSIKRGDVYFVDLSPVIGSEQGGLRPVVVVQNNVGNRYSPTVIVAAVTSKLEKCKLPTHVEVTREESGLEKDSVILTEQLRTIDKRRLQKKVAHLTAETMSNTDIALGISLGIHDNQ